VNESPVDIQDRAVFKQYTLFVLGAGASYEVGLPLGPDLAKSIRSKMELYWDEVKHRITKGDTDLFQQMIRKHQGEAQPCHAAAWRIRDGILLSSSIDDFLDIHSHDPLMNRLGKMSIVKRS
jgi:hypothetical protein